MSASTRSSVSDLKISLYGTSNPNIIFQKALDAGGGTAGNISSGTTGRLIFWGFVGGSFSGGEVRGSYSAAGGHAVELISGGQTFTVDGNGFKFSNGGAGSLFYQSGASGAGSGYFTPLTIGFAGQFLQPSGSAPAWVSTLAFVSNTRQTFAPGASVAGLNVGAVSANPSAPNNGDIVYIASTTQKFRFFQNGGWVELGGGGVSLPGSANDLLIKVDSTTFANVTSGNTGQFLQQATGSAPAWVSTLTFQSGFRQTFAASTLVAGLNVGSAAPGTNPSSAANGDIYYHSTAGKFRFRQNGVWVELGGTGGAGPATGTGTLQYNADGTNFGAVTGSLVSGGDISLTGQLALSHAVTTNRPTIDLAHTLSGSGAFANDYGFKVVYNDNYTGSFNSALGNGARGFTVAYNKGASRTSGVTQDMVFEVYASSSGSLGLTSWAIDGLNINSSFASVPLLWTALKIQPSGLAATAKRAILVDIGAGDVVFGWGGQIGDSTTGSAGGFICIPSYAAASNNPAAPASVYSSSSCQMVYNTTNNKLYIYNSVSGGWRSVALA